MYKLLMARSTTLLMLVFFCAALNLTSCTKKEGGGGSAGTPESSEILVGEYGSMTGGEATFGQSTHQGIALAFKEINEGGGVKGKKIKLLSVDDEGKPEMA